MIKNNTSLSRHCTVQYSTVQRPKHCVPSLNSSAVPTKNKTNNRFNRKANLDLDLRLVVSGYECVTAGRALRRPAQPRLTDPESTAYSGFEKNKTRK